MDNTTIRFLEMYRDRAPATGFFTRMFTPVFHASEKVAMDIQRDDDEVAIALPTIKSGGRGNEMKTYTNKEFVPTVFKEEFNLSAYDLLKRAAGKTNFEEPNFVADAQQEVMEGMSRVQRKVTRALELMSSQVFQGGVVTNINADGDTVYTIDFKEKATHKVTVGTTWATDGTTGAPLDDLEDLAEVVRQDGRRDPTDLVFGKSALRRFLANEKVVEILNNRRMERGEIVPRMANSGATLYGRFFIGSYDFRLWTYNEVYRHPQTTNLTKYVGDDNVIMLAEGARYNMSWGDIPRVVPPDPRLTAFVPGRLSDPSTGLDMIVYGWVSQDGTALTIQVACRPLTIPVAIDTFAHLKVTA